ncbi:MAG: hypothetical protein BAJALOKI3v1_40097 [Promethearchaeota archaeon]|jgi:hypothetical protein|nr:MAG: hypothetical protein BAJALOKI3v1_40097 [Candidatus Lokiarchaeota archaeon]
MPQGIFIYEIAPEFGPNVLAKYFLSDLKIDKEILEKLNEKHIEKNLVDATTEQNGTRVYSSKLESESLEDKNLYLGFILREDEDLVSLKSIFENMEQNIVENIELDDKKQMETLLKDTVNSILSLMDKLKEPSIIQETINEKTKILLDEGKLQEARELIDLGEEIPGELSETIKEADEYYQKEDYKKAKKRFLKAAELAEEIQEEEIVRFLKNKAEKVGTFPDLIDEGEDLEDNVKDIFDDFEKNQLRLYDKLIEPVERLIEIANTFEENEKYEFLMDLLRNIKKASKLAQELYDLDEVIADRMKKL